MRVKKIIGIVLLIGMFITPLIDEYIKSGLTGFIVELLSFVIMVVMFFGLTFLFSWLFNYK